MIVADVTDERHRRAGAGGRRRGRPRPRQTSAAGRVDRRPPRASALAGRRRARPAAEPAPADDEDRPPRAPPGAHRACCRGRCSWPARRRAVGSAGATPRRSTTSARPTRARSRSSAACRVRSPGFDLSEVDAGQRRRPGRPDPRRAGAGPQGHPGRRAGPTRCATLAELTSDDPAEPQPRCRLSPTPGAPSPATRRPGADVGVTQRRREPAARRRPSAPTSAPGPPHRPQPSGDRRPRYQPAAAASRVQPDETSRTPAVTAPAVPRQLRPSPGERRGRRRAPGATPSWRCCCSRMVAGRRVLGRGRGQPAASTDHAGLLGAGRRCSAAVFLGLHVVSGSWRPYADPVLLPAVALLNGLGVAFLRRLDLGRATPSERAEPGDLRRRRRPAAGLDAASR